MGENGSCWVNKHWPGGIVVPATDVCSVLSVGFCWLLSLVTESVTSPLILPEISDYSQGTSLVFIQNWTFLPSCIFGVYFHIYLSIYIAEYLIEL